MVLAGWNFRKKLTIDSTKVNTSLVDSQILVKLDSGNFNFSNAELDGKDIRFTTGDGTTLIDFDREIHLQTSSFSLDFANGGISSASSENGSEVAANGFDNNTGTFWTSLVGGGMPQWLKYDLGLGNEKTAEKFALTIRSSDTNGIPADFKIQGSNDDAIWVDLHSVIGEVWVGDGPKEYTFTNTTAYRYYRLFITATNSNSYVQVKELELMENIVAKDGYYFVKLPSISSITDTDFFIYYGNNTALDGENENAVWPNYEAVWHLAESSTGIVGEYKDATVNIHDGQAIGTLPTQIDSTIYKGQFGSGVNSYISIPDSNGFNLSGDFTISWKMFWVGSVTNGSIMGQSEGGGALPKVFINYGGVLSGQLAIVLQSSNIGFVWSPVSNTNYHCTITRSGNNFDFYVNGVAVGGTQVDSTVFPNVNAPFVLFTDGESFQWHTGQLDEVRIINGSALAQDAIITQFESDQNNLILYGPEEFVLNQTLSDINTDIRIRSTLDITDIITDIRVLNASITDISTDIRAILPDTLIDINTNISVLKGSLSDINTDIRTRFDIPINSSIVIESIAIREGYYLNILNINIDMEVGGAVKMQFRNENDLNWSTLENYTETKEWVLEPLDGIKRIFFRFIDIQGNFTDGAFSIEASYFTGAFPIPIFEVYEDGTLTTQLLDSTYQPNNNNPFFRWVIPSGQVTIDEFIFTSYSTVPIFSNISLDRIIESGSIISKNITALDLRIEMSSGFYYFSNDRREATLQEIILTDGGLLDRIDLVYIDGPFGSVFVEEGIEAIAPTNPSSLTNGIDLAYVYIPAGTTNAAAVTITDIRDTYISLSKFTNYNFGKGNNVFGLKTKYIDGSISDEFLFNLLVPNQSPDMGKIRVYTDNTKITEITNNINQFINNNPYVEWTPSPNEPGPIIYYYTIDGTDPTLLSLSTSNTNLTLGPFSEGNTEIKIVPYDTVSNIFGAIESFTFVYSTIAYPDETIVIGKNGIFRQQQGEIQVLAISWDFDSARICKLLSPVDFDTNSLFSLNEKITVVHKGVTVFSGNLKKIERKIDLGSENIIYNCIGPRGILNECYAYVTDPIFGETAQVEFNDTPIPTAIQTIVEKVPEAIKDIDSFPTGVNITDKYIGQTMDNVLQGLYARTKFGWYISPEGILKSVDSTASNPGEAKFGVYGNTINSLSPQYNVMASNIQFDITNRYNKAIVEGSLRKEKITAQTSCSISTEAKQKLEAKGVEVIEDRFKVFYIDNKWKVVKLLQTRVSFAQIKSFSLLPISSDALSRGSLVGRLSSWIIVRNNKVTTKNIVDVPNTEIIDGVSTIIAKGSRLDTTNPSDISQGSLGPNNTVRFNREIYSFWLTGATLGGSSIIDIPVVKQSTNLIGATPSYVWRFPPKKVCGTVIADVLVETVPIRVEVSLPGTAPNAKTLRIVKTEFGYSEDPNDPIDDTLNMENFAKDALNRTRDIKVEGSIILDTIDLSWNLDKTVNLINTQQNSWTSLNAKVVGISYDFNENMTTLEITSEFLK